MTKGYMFSVHPSLLSLKRMHDKASQEYDDFQKAMDDLDRIFKKNKPESRDDTIKPRTLNWEFHEQVARLAPHIADQIYAMHPDTMGPNGLPQRIEMWERIMQRLADGYIEYGDNLFTMSDEQLQKENEDEVLDTIVYTSEQRARDLDVDE